LKNLQNNPKSHAWLVSSKEDITQVASDVLQLLPQGPVLLELQGEMGAGKTTLATALLVGCGVLDPLLGSPTYPVLHRYRMSREPQVAFHLDLYRLHGDEEIYERGIHESVELEPGLLLVEWGEIAKKWIQGLKSDRFLGSSFRLEIEVLSESSRRIRFSPSG
jgi:tRNA threonylcarbamoyl adenosine modification protein YjeE